MSLLHDEKITKKFGEEAFEVVIGAMKNDREEVTNETADLLYHLFVLLHDLDISFTEVEEVLAERHKHACDVLLILLLLP